MPDRDEPARDVPSGDPAKPRITKGRLVIWVLGAGAGIYMLTAGVLGILGVTGS
ncbi:hypothetical protein [Microbacterium sp. SCN 69-37]|uniref:hypothetical protein n=1 Tax=Microbacterium sp. SCN 69-37 TaxID=1660115 RepID=UPI0025FD7F90|nr:hypothetical protein [Microbacterium sp. SCN 69-37]